MIVSPGRTRCRHSRSRWWFHPHDPVRSGGTGDRRGGGGCRSGLGLELGAAWSADRNAAGERLTQGLRCRGARDECRVPNLRLPEHHHGSPDQLPLSPHAPRRCRARHPDRRRGRRPGRPPAPPDRAGGRQYADGRDRPDLDRSRRLERRRDGDHRLARIDLEADRERHTTRLEGALAGESTFPTARIIPLPDGTDVTVVDALRADPEAGGVALPTTTSAGFGDGRASAPQKDRGRRRLSPRRSAPEPARHRGKGPAPLDNDDLVAHVVSPPHDASRSRLKPAPIRTGACSASCPCRSGASAAARQRPPGGSCPNRSGASMA